MKKINKIVVSISKQKLYVFCGRELIKTYPCSTSKYGEGSEVGSNKTPLGKHKICELIGESLPKGAILKSREFTGELSKIILDTKDSGIDCVTSRILRLQGCEPSNSNSFERYIYIHGTNEEGLIGTKASHGCVRLKNDDIIELFAFVEIACEVVIEL